MLLIERSSLNYYNHSGLRFQDLDMLAAQLNELGVRPGVGAAPPRQNGGSKPSHSNVLDLTDSEDSEDDGEEGGIVQGRPANDGTLLASDPPKPL